MFLYVTTAEKLVFTFFRTENLHIETYTEFGTVRVYVLENSSGRIHHPDNKMLCPELFPIHIRALFRIPMCRTWNNAIVYCVVLLRAKQEVHSLKIARINKKQLYPNDNNYCYSFRWLLVCYNLFK